MRKFKASSYILMGIMAIALIALLLSLGMEHWKSKLLPLILSGLILILGAIELRGEILEQDKPSSTVMEGATSEGKESRKILRGYLITAAWVGGFLLAIFLIGFPIAIPLFTFSYMKLHGSTWLGAVILSIVVLGFMYVVSEPLAGIKLYRGLLPTYLGELMTGAY
jgi:hypothetical protein